MNVPPGMNTKPAGQLAAVVVGRAIVVVGGGLTVVVGGGGRTAGQHP